MAEENNNKKDENSRNIKESRKLEACAVCKYLRRKCRLEKCPLWRFFPASETKQVLAIHNIFGISNLTKKIKELGTQEEKARAASAFKQQAMLWEKYPVYGPSGEILRLKQENMRLKYYIQQLQRNHSHVHPNMLASSYAGLRNTARLANNEQMGSWYELLERQMMGYNGNNVNVGVGDGSVQTGMSSETKMSLHNQGGYNSNMTTGNSSGVNLVEGYNGNNANVGIGEYDWKRNTSVNMAGSDGRRGGYSVQTGMSSGTKMSMHNQGGYNSNMTTYKSSSGVNPARGYDSGRVVGMGLVGSGSNIVNVEGGGVGETWGNLGGYTGNIPTSVGHTIGRGGYGSGRMVGVQVGRNIANAEGVVRQIGGSPGTGQSFDHQRGYNGNNTDANERGYDSGRIVGMEAVSGEEGGSEDVAQNWK